MGTALYSSLGLGVESLGLEIIEGLKLETEFFSKKAGSRYGMTEAEKLRENQNLHPSFYVCSIYMHEKSVMKFSRNLFEKVLILENKPTVVPEKYEFGQACSPLN